ncbi:MAG: glycosyltransferase family 2 protein [Bdellovibrionia bacterium]
MSHVPLSVTIITLNEEKNILRAIQSVSWAQEVLVVDSGSTDQTVALAQAAGARVVTHAWQGYGQQKNYAQSLTQHDWVLNLDADECVSPELKQEIQAELSRLDPKNPQVVGFFIPRRTYYLGQWIRYGGWYPNYLVRLAHKGYAQWSEPQVHEAWQVQGPTLRLKHPLDHYAFNSIRDQILTNLTFSHLGSQELQRRGKPASLLRLIFKPLGKFLETYVLKKGFFDGKAGLIISVNAAYSMFLKYAYLFEDDIRKPPSGT